MSALLVACGTPAGGAIVSARPAPLAPLLVAEPAALATDRAEAPDEARGDTTEPTGAPAD